MTHASPEHNSFWRVLLTIPLKFTLRLRAPAGECSSLFRDFNSNLATLLLGGGAEKLADCLDRASSFANQTTHVGLTHREKVGGFVTLLTMLDKHFVGKLDELLHHIAQKLVHTRIN